MMDGPRYVINVSYENNEAIKNLLEKYKWKNKDVVVTFALEELVRKLMRRDDLDPRDIFPSMSTFRKIGDRYIPTHPIEEEQTHE